MNRTIVVTALITASLAYAHALSPISDRAQVPAPLLHATGQINAVWSRVGLPTDKGVAAPVISVAIAPNSTAPAVRIESNASYGHLLQKGPWPAGVISWQWRLDTPLSKANLQEKAGDDAALKVCVSFAHHDASVPWGERLLLRIARSTSALDLPAATICYIWDNRYPIGTTGANPYTKRVRYMVLQTNTSALNEWTTQRRNLSDDFLKLFGDEAQVVPPVSAIAVGADTDNTQEQALGWVNNLRWETPATY